MAWPGKSQIMAYAVTNAMTDGTANAGVPATDTMNLALYGTGSPVNTGTAFTAAAGNVYGTTWQSIAESTGSSYSPGGTALTSPTSQQNGATWVYACTTAISWTVTGGISAYGGLIYDTSKTNASLCYLDFLGNQVVSGAGTFTVTFAPNIAVITCT